jgi:Na+/H+ antiporter NhaD/arsenite permease-like protein
MKAMGNIIGLLLFAIGMFVVVKGMDSITDAEVRRKILGQLAAIGKAAQDGDQ